MKQKKQIALTLILCLNLFSLNLSFAGASERNQSIEKKLVDFGGEDKVEFLQEEMKQKQDLTSDQKEKINSISSPFVKNEGQKDEKVAYYADVNGGTLFVTKEGEMVYSFIKYEQPTNNGRDADLSRLKNQMTDPKNIKDNLPKPIGGIAIKETLIDAKKIGEIKPEEEQITKMNFFLGNDEEKWRTDVKTYKTINMGEVYDGINLKLDRKGNNVEKLFFVSPGADPGKIKMKMEGADEISINPETKQLEAKTELGTIAFTSPVAY